jgi:hypothetical protein
MIVIKLRGGLANQMFEYALGRYLSLKHNVPLYIDLIHFENEQSVEKTIRAFGLDIFDIEASIATQNDVFDSKGWYQNRFKRKFNTLSNKFKPYYKVNSIKEKYPHFDKNILKAPKNCYVEGFWQSEHYFKAIRNEIIKDFTIKKAPSQKNEALLELIKNSNSVSVHVRRGDYVNNKHYENVHRVLSMAYYEEAIEFISHKIENPIFFIFSDDMEWVKANFSFKDKLYFVDHNNAENAYEDMRLMQNCKNNIIANSSFSWWAAWLNTNDEKIVIAPKTWYKMKKLENKDIMPKEWIKIENQ